MPKSLKPVRQRDLIQRLAEVLINSGITVEEAAAQFHRALLEVALAEAGGNQVEAAAQQKMPRTTLRNQVISLGLLNGPRRSASQSTDSPQAQDTEFPSASPVPAPAPPLSLHGLPYYIGDEDHPITSGTFYGIKRSEDPTK